MHIKWFRIFNFRSISDSGICHINKELTIMAGKNESGKSNVLKALEAFTNDNFDESYDYPINAINEELPSIIISLSLNLHEIGKMYARFLSLSKNYKFQYEKKDDLYELIVHKTNDEITKIEGNWFDTIEFIRLEEIKYWENKVKEKVINLKNNNLFEQSFLNSLFLIIKNEDFSKALKQEIVNYTETNSNFDSILADLEKLEVFYITDQINDFIESVQLPRTILFSSFTDLLPDKIEQDDATTSAIVKRFFKLVDVDIDNIFSETSKQKRKQIVNKASGRITGDFAGFYKQNEIRLTIDVDGTEISFFLYDGKKDDPFKPEQRSQGFQWFLSFYITLMAEKLSANTVILIDEPGLYLHAKAQEDMLKVLEDISGRNQVIFTTHSPYLIDTHKLERIRLVVKEDSKTTIESKFHKVADKDTLTPIVTAIGYDLSKGMTFSRELNVITEGISDYYYLIALRDYLKISDSQLAFIPSVGVDQIPNISSILIGWGAPILCLLDNDAQGRGVAKKLRDKLNLEENKEFLFISDSKIAIEDLFSIEDFYSYVLLEDKITEDVENNSKVANEKGKVILAKKLSENVKNNNLTFSEETVQNFKIIFEKISEVLVNR